MSCRVLVDPVVELQLFVLRTFDIVFLEVMIGFNRGKVSSVEFGQFVFLQLIVQTVKGGHGYGLLRATALHLVNDSAGDGGEDVDRDESAG
ncbi:hypothetical protein Hanom_Chr16g01444401 [Helianthus anomalus]